MESKCPNSHSEFLFNRRLLNSKCSQSAVISTVLLIMIVIVAIVIVMGFVIPFVKDKLSSGDCLDVVGKVEVNTGAYTCYDAGGNEMKVQVHILDIADLIDGFSIELGGAESKTVKIEDEAEITDVIMYNGTSTLKLPENNEARTYIVSGITEEPSLIAVYPILKGGKMCAESDFITNIDSCVVVP